MHSTFQQPQQTWKHRQGSNGQHYGHKKQKTSGGAVNRYYAPPNMPTMQPYQPFGSWPNGLTNLQASTGHGYGNPAISTQTAAITFQQQAYEAMAQLSYHGIPSYLQTPVTPYSGFFAQAPGTGYHTWSDTPVAIPAQMPLTDQHEMQQHTTVASDQAYFEFMAGHGPVNEDELSEDAEEYCEFTRGCPYVKDADVDKNLSIGLVLMKTARPANAALPATWEEANPDPTHPVKAIAYEPERCPSMYHSESQKEETLKHVRDSADWEELKQDSIFKTFPKTPKSLTSGTTLRSAFTRRPDPPPDPPSRRSSTYSNPAASQPERLQKKRIFSQTDHDVDQESNKRARDTQQHNHSHRRRSSSRERLRMRSRECKQPRNMHHPIPAKPITAQSRIFQNGQLLPPSDVTVSAASNTDQTVVPAATAEQDMQAEVETRAIKPDQVPPSKEHAGNHVIDMPVDMAPAVATTSTNGSALADSVNTATDKGDRRESAWTRLARQYQAQAMQDTEIIDFD